MPTSVARYAWLTRCYLFITDLSCLHVAIFLNIHIEIHVYIHGK